MADATRARRLADRIRVIVAQYLETRVQDPRIGFLTITDARVSPDLRDATVFYTVLGDEQAKADTAAALSDLTGTLRSEVGRQTGVKFTPTLVFLPDAVPENARTIEDLLAAARSRDAEVAALAQTAAFAGEADPYRHPEESDDEDPQS